MPYICIRRTVNFGTCTLSLIPERAEPEGSFIQGGVLAVANSLRGPAPKRCDRFMCFLVNKDLPAAGAAGGLTPAGGGKKSFEPFHMHFFNEKGGLHGEGYEISPNLEELILERHLG